VIELYNTKLAVFDLDDTLYSERDFVDGGFRNVVAHVLGYDKPDLINPWLRKVAELSKQGRRDIFQVLLADLNQKCTPARIDELVQVYRTSDRALKCFPDAESVLFRWKDAGLPVAILTDGPLEAQQTKVRLLNLDRKVDQVLYTDQYGPGFGKPSVKCFQMLMKTFRVEPEECVYFADNEMKDFYAPNLLGWKSVKVQRPGGVYADGRAKEPSYAPQCVVADLEQVLIAPKNSNPWRKK